MQDKNIKVKDVCKYFGETQVLNHVNMECNQEEITGIIGRNGVEKTVLFKIICGLLSLDSDEVVINGIKREKQADAFPSFGIINRRTGFFGFG